MLQWAREFGYSNLSVEALCDPDPPLALKSRPQKKLGLLSSDTPKEGIEQEAREQLRSTILADLHRYGRDSHLKGYEQVRALNRE